jgi:hypothetical protein
MARLGDNSSPELATWRQGNIRQQAATRLTMPEAGRITHVGAWLRGVQGYGSLDYRLCVWKWDGATSDTNRLLGQSALKNTSAAAFSVGSLLKYTWPMEVAVELPAGANFMVGIATDTDAGMAAQWGLQSGSGPYYQRDTGAPAGQAWPTNMSNCYSTSSALAAWVEAYTPIGKAQVFRNGAWVDVEGVLVYRNGVWVDAEAVQVNRSGGWIDAG